MIGEYLVEQGGSVVDVVLDVLNVRFVELISHSLATRIFIASVSADARTHVPGQNHIEKYFLRDFTRIPDLRGQL